MDKKSLLAIALSIFILVVYQEFISYFYPPRPAPSSPLQPSTPPPASVPSTPPAAEKSVQTAPAAGTAATETATALASAPARELTIENDVYSAVLTSLGGRLKSLRLKHYPGDTGKDSTPREMIKTSSNGEYPLGFRLEGKETVLSDEAVRYETESENVQIHGEAQATVEFTGKLTNGSLVTKTFTFNGTTHGIALTVKVADAPETVRFASLAWTHAIDLHGSSSSQLAGPVALIDRKFVHETTTDLKKEEKDLGPGRIRWGGYADTYFLAAMIPPESETNHFWLSASEGNATTKLSVPWNREPVAYTLYVGPKDFAALNAVNTILDRAIDFGWSHFISRPLVHMLRFSHSLTGNYGIDIIILTFLVKLVFFPLSNKSFKSMAQMREVQPLMERLREQYKDDRERLNKEMMELYRRYKVNPLGGCLPMLVQMPVFFGLYQALSSAIELRQAPFFGWIQDLSLPDRLGSLDLWFIAPPGIPVLTLLMGATMLIQQTMTPAQGDPMQQKMMMLMPVIFTVMFVNFPSGLVLYWLVNNVLSIAQQYAYQKGLI
ncbi:MAG: membrane protein insertase YidC [Deltaproteobacteria bacterium]|nr:membrane protein insertase YidC [Deltaproteobacteria bacterium]